MLIKNIQVDDLNPYRIKNEWTDVSQVKKFEISEEEYNKRNGNYFYIENNNNKNNNNNK